MKARQSIYKLEEKIMSAWNIIDDIRLLAETQSNRPMTQDELENFLLGLETIYSVKFEVLFSEYEKFLKEYYSSGSKRILDLSDDELDSYRQQQCAYE